MIKLKKIAVALALLGCGGTANVMAQPSYNPSWYVSPSVNWLDPDRDFGVGRRGEGLGLRFGKAMTPHWDLQLGPTYSRSNQNGVRYEQDTFGVDGLFLFSRNQFRPFVLIGAGAERDKIRTPFITSSKTSPYFNAGVGFQYDFSERWGMQADYRRVQGRLRDNFFGQRRSDNDYLTLGLIYRFGPVLRHVDRVVAAPSPAPVERIAPAPIVTPPPTPAPTPPPPPPPRFERYTLKATELFSFDRADLRMPQPKLDEIVAALKSNPQVGNVAVIGYTDRLGSEKYNLKLSKRRADAVKNYLVSQGVAASRLVAEGRGEANPIVQCKQKNRAALIKCLEPNRRVEIEQIVIERRVQ